MSPQMRDVRQQLQTMAGRALPPTLSLPLRARFGGSREPELAILPQLVHTGDTVIDVGAHKGVYTYRLARLVGPSGHVVAYEPQPSMIAYLRAASKSGLMRNVDLRTYALGGQEGEAVLSVPDVVDEGHSVESYATLRSVGRSASEHRVWVAVLDQEPLPGRVNFIKIDVEGFELPLLKGARELLARDHPALLIEIEHRHAGAATAETAEVLLDELGYSASELDGTALRPVPRDRWGQGAALNERPGARYVNNFVFQA